jgi:hypothetical protein
MRMRGKVLPIALHRSGRDEETERKMQQRNRIKSRLFVLRSWLKTGRKWGDWYRQEKGRPLTAEDNARILQEIRRLEQERSQLAESQIGIHCESAQMRREN